MAGGKPMPAMLLAEPIAATGAAVLTYFGVAKFLPAYLVRLFPPGIEGDPPPITVEALQGPLHWVALAAALAFLVEAGVLARRATRAHKAWQSGEAPSCPRCGGLMKQKRSFWRCYRFPLCRGTVDV